MNAPALEQFRDAIRAAGLNPPEAIHGDGKLRRFASNGNPNDESGWYVFHDDERPAGAFGDWRSDIAEKWRAENTREWTAAEKAEYRTRIATIERERNADDARRHTEARERATAILGAATGDATQHPYAKLKRADFGPLVKRGAWPQREWSDALLVPLYDAQGVVQTIEAINADGDKDFLLGGKKRGAFHPFNQIRGASRVLIGEGLATVMACVAGVEWPAAVAMDAGNLIHVAKIVRELAAPGADIVIVADNDVRDDGTPNTGIEAANRAAAAVGGRVGVPILDGRKCDFWDVWAECGVEPIKRAIANAKAPEVSEAQPSTANATGRHTTPVGDEEPDSTKNKATGAPTDTEMEIAAVFAQRGAGSLLYVAGLDWYVNAGPRWQRDEKLERFTLANALCRAAGSDARDSARNRIETNKTAAAIVSIARPDLIAVPRDFDVLPYELNTPDGVLDLRDGAWRSRAASDRFMHCTAVTPDPRGTRGTIFAEFLSEITCDDGGLARFLQTMLGAALFASSALEDHWLAFLVGAGRNGKGTLIEKCAGRAMGTYARRIPAEVLLADDRGTRHPTEIANLLGSRLAYASEIDEGRRWNESRLKELSGGDKLSGRFMRQDLFEFVPSHRLVIYANHRPIIQNPDPAFRARLKLVPFNASFVGREDTTLPERLSRELPLILGWMVAGASAYWEAGRLANCAVVDAASAAYFEMHATFDAWLEERCYVDPANEERAKSLYADFKTWKTERGEGVPSQTRWGETMSTRFKRRESHGVIWCGLGLRP